MRTLIFIGVVSILAVVGTFMAWPSAVVQGAAGGGPIVTLDSGQFPLPVTVSGSASADLNPYQETKAFNWGFSTCSAFACELSFAVVPAGKRLIVENVSGAFAISAPSAIRTVRLSGAGTVSWTLPTVLQSTFQGASTFAMNTQVRAHFEAGQTPKVFVNTDSNNQGYSNEITLSGHYITLP